jgi:chromate transport protein ChrA
MPAVRIIVATMAMSVMVTTRTREWKWRRSIPRIRLVNVTIFFTITFVPILLFAVLTTLWQFCNEQCEFRKQQEIAARKRTRRKKRF